MRRFHIACIIVAGWLIQAAVSAESQRLASRDDAYIARDQASDTWTIGNDGTALIVGLDRVGDYRIVAMVDPACSTRSTIADSSAPTSGRWAGRFRPFTGRRPTIRACSR